MKTIEKIIEVKRWFFEKINKVDQAIARLIKKNRGRHQLPVLEMNHTSSHERETKDHDTYKFDVMI